MDVPQRILLVRLSHLGDVVHAVPVFHALRAAYPGADIAWAIQGEFGALVEGLSGLERLFLFHRRGGLSAWFSLRRELRAWRPDWTVDAQGNLKSAAVAWCAGANRRYGLAPKDWREPLGARVLTHPAPPSCGPHAIHRARALLERAAPGQGLSFDLELDEEERARGRAAFERHLDGALDASRWILHLGAPDDPRTWPAERFAALARRLADAGGRVLILSGPGEADSGTRLRAELTSNEDIDHLVGQRGLRELAALFAAAAEKSARVVACDSGPAHVAAACGAGVDLLSGPQDPDRTGPWPPAEERDSPHRVLRPDPRGVAPIEALSLDAVAAALLGGAPTRSA